MVKVTIYIIIVFLYSDEEGMAADDEGEIRQRIQGKKVT